MPTDIDHTFAIENIIEPQEVIHPSLDWVQGQLIVGVVLKGKKQVILSSKGTIASPEKIGPLCQQAAQATSHIRQDTAQRFLNRDVIDGTKLLTHISEYLRAFVAFPDPKWADPLAVWVLGTYLFPMFQTYPYVWITSPKPGSGKSVLGQLIANVSFGGEFMVSPNEAHLFRLAESRGTQVWDEIELSVDTEKKRFERIQPILLNGYRNGGVVPRQRSKSYEYTDKYHVFCPRVFIGLSRLPEPALQRTIMIRLQQRTKDQRVKLYRHPEMTKEEDGIRAECQLWALQNATKVNDRYGEDILRASLEDQMGEAGRETDDIWLPLSAVATVAWGVDDLSKGSKNFSVMIETAKELARGRRATGWQIGVAASAQPDSSNQFRLEECRVALGVLEFSCPIEPAALAERLGQAVGREVEASRLCKTLGRLGIKSTKKGGRRVFNVSKDQIEIARRKLNGADTGTES